MVATPAQPVSVVICVHNALRELATCLASVIRAGGYHRIVLVNDGSDTVTVRWLSRIAHRPDVLLVNSKQRGYSHAVNTAVDYLPHGDVVLLNSDTIVPATWIPRLARAAYHDADSAVAGPWSNAASWQTLGDQRTRFGQWQAHTRAPYCDVAAINQVLGQSIAVHPKVAVLNGFCMYFRAPVLQALRLDAEHFPSGYGEENDFALRLARQGKTLRVADDCYVYHHKSASFGHARRLRLTIEADRTLRQIHGDAAITALTAGMRNNPELWRSHKLATQRVRRLSTH